jgi:hypothetical protein
VKTASIMFDEKTVPLIKATPSSDNTAERVIQNIVWDIVDLVTENIRKFKQLSVQLDRFSWQGTTVGFFSGSWFIWHNGAYIVLQQFKRKGDNRRNFLHKQALACKHMYQAFHKTMAEAITVINYIKSRPVNSSLFHRLCTDFDSENTAILLQN